MNEITPLHSVISNESDILVRGSERDMYQLWHFSKNCQREILFTFISKCFEIEIEIEMEICNLFNIYHMHCYHRMEFHLILILSCCLYHMDLCSPARRRSFLLSDNLMAYKCGKKHIECSYGFKAISHSTAKPHSHSTYCILM